jgi:hypothetical protein
LSPGENERRWQELAALHEELEHDEVVVPMVQSRIDGKPIRSSERALKFAEGLAFSDVWSGIPPASRRRAA